MEFNFRAFGIPEILISDRGPEFSSVSSEKSLQWLRELRGQTTTDGQLDESDD